MKTQKATGRLKNSIAQILNAKNRYFTSLKQKSGKIELFGDGLFQKIGDAVKQRADSITVTYDETFGYPTEIRIDMNLFGRDDEIWYAITDFEVLN